MSQATKITAIAVSKNHSSITPDSIYSSFLNQRQISAGERQFFNIESAPCFRATLFVHARSRYSRMLAIALKVTRKNVAAIRNVARIVLLKVPGTLETPPRRLRYPSEFPKRGHAYTSSAAR